MLRITEVKKSNESGGTATIGGRETAAGSVGVESPVFENAPAKATAEPAGELLGSNHAAAILPWITEELRFHSVLDLGSGNGLAVKLLNEAGYDAHGIDLAPGSAYTKNIRRGNFFETGHDDGFFDAVLCGNVMQEVPAARVPQLLLEIDRLSNSYVFITAPSTEGKGDKAHPVSWWVDRIQDLGWRFRLIREDAETGQLALLCEKPNSLASQVLPLIDAANPANASESPRRSTTSDNAATKDPGDAIRSAISHAEGAIAGFLAANPNLAFGLISEMADVLIDSGIDLSAVHPILNGIVTAMESNDTAGVETLLRRELLPALRRY